MPYVNVRILKGATKAQKAQIVADITRSLVETLGKKPEHTHVVIDEVDEDNWGFAGQLTTDLRAAKEVAGAEQSQEKVPDA